MSKYQVVRRLRGDKRPKFWEYSDRTRHQGFKMVSVWNWALLVWSDGAPPAPKCNPEVHNAYARRLAKRSEGMDR